MTTQDNNQIEKQADLIKFKLSEPEYNPKTYFGRTMNLLRVQNPVYTFARNSKIEAARKMVNDHMQLEEEYAKENKPMMITQERAKELRNANYLVKSSIHPDTGKILQPWQRFCSYAMINTPFLFGMVLTKQTTTNIIFWQWINQTYNAILNYSNRNASSEVGMTGVGAAYFTAVTSSIYIGLKVKKMLMPYSNKFKGPSQLIFNFLINFSAMAAAGILNSLVMRSSEFKDGIHLFNADGEDAGLSPKVGREAVVKTAATRIGLALRLFVPTVVFFVMEKKNMIPKNKLGKFFLEATVFFSSMVLVPPMSCAVYEQYCTVKTKDLEEKFHDLKDAQGKPITELYYNRGL